MSNEAYDKLHKLVAYLLKYGIVSKARLSQELGMSLIDFLDEFKDEVEAIDEEYNVASNPSSNWLLDPEE